MMRIITNKESKGKGGDTLAVTWLYYLCPDLEQTELCYQYLQGYNS